MLIHCVHKCMQHTKAHTQTHVRILPFIEVNIKWPSKFIIFYTHSIAYLPYLCIFIYFLKTFIFFCVEQVFSFTYLQNLLNLGWTTDLNEQQIFFNCVSLSFFYVFFFFNMPFFCPLTIVCDIHLCK